MWIWPSTAINCDSFTFRPLEEIKLTVLDSTTGWDLMHQVRRELKPNGKPLTLLKGEHKLLMQSTLKETWKNGRLFFLLCFVWVWTFFGLKTTYCTFCCLRPFGSVNDLGVSPRRGRSKGWKHQLICRTSTRRSMRSFVSSYRHLEDWVTTYWEDFHILDMDCLIGHFHLIYDWTVGGWRPLRWNAWKVLCGLDCEEGDVCLEGIKEISFWEEMSCFHFWFSIG